MIVHSLDFRWHRLRARWALWRSPNYRRNTLLERERRVAVARDDSSPIVYRREECIEDCSQRWHRICIPKEIERLVHWRTSMPNAGPYLDGRWLDAHPQRMLTDIELSRSFHRRYVQVRFHRRNVMEWYLERNLRWLGVLFALLLMDIESTRQLVVFDECARLIRIGFPLFEKVFDEPGESVAWCRM